MKAHTAQTECQPWHLMPLSLSLTHTLTHIPPSMHSLITPPSYQPNALGTLLLMHSYSSSSYDSCLVAAYLYLLRFSLSLHVYICRPRTRALVSSRRRLRGSRSSSAWRGNPSLNGGLPRQGGTKCSSSSTRSCAMSSSSPSS